MAETKKKKVVAATAEEKKKAAGKRVLAIVFWVLALGCELVAFMNLSGKWYLPNLIPALPDNYLLYLIIFLVLDLIFLIIGSQIWKQANRLDPASKENKVAFFLQNQMGLIVAIACFVPFIIKLFAGKDLKIDGKQKTIVAVVACAALLVGGLASVDWNPISAEEKIAAQEEIEGAVIVTQFGHCYHTNPDCQSIRNSANQITSDENLTNQPEGWTSDGVISVVEAIDGGWTKLCSYCQHAAEQE